MGAAGIIGVLTVLATLHSNDSHFRWWWPTNWLLLPLLIFVIGLVLLVVPVQRSRAGTLALQATGPVRPASGASTSQGVPKADATAGDAEPTDAGGDEMIYDIRLNPIKDLLVHYIYRPADISMLSRQSGLDQGSIVSGGAAVNYWQEVLERACIEGVPRVDALLDCAVRHLKNTVGEAPLQAAVERYRQARG